MKKLFLAVVAALSIVAAQADGITVNSITAAGATNLVAGNYLIQAISILNTSTNANVVKFWDTGTSTTNVIRGAYTSYASYATNFTKVFTNESNVIITNTFVGTFTAPTSNAAITNAAPSIYTIVVPASTTLSKELTIVTTKGLTAVSSADCTVAVTYKGNP